MYTVVPIRCGALSANKAFLTYRIDGDVEYEFAVFAFLLRPEDPADPVALVDTGVKPTDSEYMRGRDNRQVGPPGGGSEPLVEGLAREGLEPGDVDAVVLTHLHHDHAANLELFPDAEFVLQRAELEAIRDPLPIAAGSYIPGTLEFLEGAELHVVDGDVDLAGGIELLFTPGHTEGSQTVVVPTPGGEIALIADLAYSRHNLQPGIDSIVDAAGEPVPVTPQDMDYIPPGIHVDVRACYESIARVQERLGDGGTIVPSHDPSVADLR